MGKNNTVKGNFKGADKATYQAQAEQRKRIDNYNAKGSKNECDVQNMDPMTTTMLMSAAVHDAAYRRQKRKLTAIYEVGKQARRNNARFATALGKAKALDIEERTDFIKEAYGNYMLKHDELKERFDNLANDCAGSASPLLVGVVTLVGGLLIGGVVGYALNNHGNNTSSNNKPKGPTVVPAINDTIFNPSDNHVLYLNGTPVTDADVTAHVAEKFLYGDNQILEAQKLLDANYTAGHIGFEIYKDGSASTHVENEDHTIKVDHKIPSNVVHKEILSKLSGTYYNEPMKYVFVP
jgi:hypothetical protein